MQHHALAIGALRRHCGIDRRARVYDQRIARVEKQRKLREPSMYDAVVARIGRHQAYLVAGDAASLRRLVRLQYLG